MLLPEFENKGIGLFEITEAAVPAGTAAFASADPIGENANFKALIRKALKCVFLLGAALASGMVGRMKNRR